MPNSDGCESDRTGVVVGRADRVIRLLFFCGGWSVLDTTTVALGLGQSENGKGEAKARGREWKRTKTKGLRKTLEDATPQIYTIYRIHVCCTTNAKREKGKKKKKYKYKFSIKSQWEKRARWATAPKPYLITAMSKSNRWGIGYIRVIPLCCPLYTAQTRSSGWESDGCNGDSAQ